MIHLDYEYKKEGQAQWQQCNQSAILHMQHLKLKFEWRKTQIMRLEVINDKPLPGNDCAPPLKIGEIKELVSIQLDSKGNKHLDVGLVSKLAFIRSYETKEQLKDGDKIHWCHPSRFKVLTD